jgi:hypothetical protein
MNPYPAFSGRAPALGWALALLLIVPAACKRAEEPAPAPPAPAPTPAPAAVRIVDVEVGRSIGADKRVTEATEVFAPGDTIYAVVLTDGSAPSATLTARWTFEDGQVVEEQNLTIAPNGSEANEFHASKPDGWPAGSYQVEVLLDGGSVAKKSFRVQ